MHRLPYKLAIVTLAGAFAATYPACSTVSKVNATIDKAGKALDNVQKLAANFNDTLSQLKGQATKPTSQAPVASANLPQLPPQATGGANLVAPVSGKSGTATADVEGTGTPIPVQVFEADSTTSGQSAHLHLQDFTSDNATTFLAWQGAAGAPDDGQCYLGWEASGKVWFMVANCGESTAAVCSDDGTTVTCAGCDASGQCTPCDDNATLDVCASQAPAAADAGGSDDGGGDVAEAIDGGEADASLD
jgi:hypothetical protein